MFVDTVRAPEDRSTLLLDSLAIRKHSISHQFLKTQKPGCEATLGAFSSSGLSGVPRILGRRGCGWEDVLYHLVSKFGTDRVGAGRWGCAFLQCTQECCGNSKDIPKVFPHS